MLVAGHEEAGSFLGAPAWERADSVSAFAQTQSLVGRSFGRYQLLSVLGRGGTGTVYLAEDTRLERKIALKLLPSQFFDEPEHMRRFEREVRAISALSHPNIVAVHDTGETEQVGSSSWSWLPAARFARSPAKPSTRRARASDQAGRSSARRSA